MNWPVIFLGCFVVGFVLSALSLAFGIVDMHVHFPWETHVHVGPAHTGHMHGLGPINFATITAFIAWFGGAGYLQMTQFRWLTVPALVGAVPVGLTGSAIVFLLMAKVLWSPHENMQLADYHMVGVLGRIGHSIREGGGTGELIYAHAGSRHSCGARSADGRAIEHGAEVVVTAYDRGIAYVRRWDELAAGQS